MSFDVLVLFFAIVASRFFLCLIFDIFRQHHQTLVGIHDTAWIEDVQRISAPIEKFDNLGIYVAESSAPLDTYCKDVSKLTNDFITNLNNFNNYNFILYTTQTLILAHIDAVYALSTNYFTIPITISFNFGGLGRVGGHGITHGFDSHGKSSVDQIDNDVINNIVCSHKKNTTNNNSSNSDNNVHNNIVNKRVRKKIEDGENENPNRNDNCNNNNTKHQNHSGNNENPLQEGQSSDDLDIMLHSCWASSFIAQEIASAKNVNNNKLFGVMNALNVLQQIATHIKLTLGGSQKQHNITLTVARSFGNLVTGIRTDEMTSYIINETNILLIMKEYLGSKKFKISTRNDSNIVKQTCCVSGDHTAGTQEQVMKIINLGLIHY